MKKSLLSFFAFFMMTSVAHAAVNKDPFGFNKQAEPELTEEQKMEQQILAALKQCVPYVSFALHVAQDEFFAMTDAYSAGKTDLSLLRSVVQKAVEAELAYRAQASSATPAQKAECDKVLSALFASFEKDELAKELVQVYGKNLESMYKQYKENHSKKSDLQGPAIWAVCQEFMKQPTQAGFEALSADDKLAIFIMDNIIKESALVVAEFSAFPQVQQLVAQ